MKVTGGAIPDAMIGAVRYAVASLIHERRIAGRGVPIEVMHLHRHLMSERGHADALQHNPVGQLKASDDLVGASEAAVILGCTERHVIRLAVELSGTQLAGRRTWLFPRDRVVAYAQRRRECA